jgi:hypothetical protein
VKIIGKTETGYLLDAKAYEVAALSGHDLQHYDSGDSRIILCEGWPTMHVGTEFKVDVAWRQIHRNANREREIELIKQSLEGAIHNLTMAEPFLVEPKPDPAEEK